MTEREAPASVSVEAARPSRRMAPRALAAVVLLLVGAGGALAGVALDRAWLARRPGAHVGYRRPPFRGGGDGVENSGGRDPARRRASMLDAMARDLSLTPAQRAQLDTIFQRRDSQYQALSAEVQPRMQRLMEETHAEIDRVLTPAQRTRYAELRAARARERAARGRR